MQKNKFPMSAKIFISHPHYDHINGFPFFKPLYMQGNEFEILGASHGDISLEKLLSDQMDSIYFPITMNEFCRQIKFPRFGEDSYDIEGVKVKTLLLNHPANAWAIASNTMTGLSATSPTMKFISKILRITFNSKSTA